jgi:hypothetical protein
MHDQKERDEVEPCKKKNFVETRNGWEVKRLWQAGEQTQ